MLYECKSTFYSKFCFENDIFCPVINESLLHYISMAGKTTILHQAIHVCNSCWPISSSFRVRYCFCLFIYCYISNPVLVCASVKVTKTLNSPSAQPWQYFQGSVIKFTGAITQRHIYIWIDKIKDGFMSCLWWHTIWHQRCVMGPFKWHQYGHWNITNMDSGILVC